MHESTNDSNNMPNGKAPNVRGRPTTLRGGHDPSNLGRLSGKARREKAHAREADADLNKLALRARLAVIGAGQLDAQALTDVATGHDSGHVRVQASRLLLDLARASVEDAPEDPDSKPLVEMSPEEKVAMLARLDKALREMDETELEDGERADPPARHSLPWERDLAVETLKVASGRGCETTLSGSRGRRCANPLLTRSR
jgi:hypothetical protein